MATAAEAVLAEQVAAVVTATDIKRYVERRGVPWGDVLYVFTHFYCTGRSTSDQFNR